MTKKHYRASCSMIAIFMLELCGTTAAISQDNLENTSVSKGISEKTSGDIIVTAQKRAQSINNVGMTITAASSSDLLNRGITNVAELAKAVPGFTFNTSGYGTPIYTIRGVGFQESAVAASPAVSIYVDEIPLPYPDETTMIGLDVERVEVLKGPQGTLYGQNSTGGAINYISARPTEDFHAGADVSFGRFNTLVSQGFVSGPISDTLTARVSVGLNEGSPWQKSYTRNAKLGATDQYQGRLLLDWHPNENLKVSLNVSGWRDHSDTIGSQLLRIRQAVPPGTIPIGLENYPPAPKNNRAADWDADSSLFKKNDRFFQSSLRIDWKLSPDLTLTSLTAYQKYKRNETMDEDGTSYLDFNIGQRSRINTIYQELRLSGTFNGEGNWIVGANYESDKTYELLLGSYDDSSYRDGVGFIGNANTANQPVKTYAAFANAEHKLTDTLSLQGGVRFTEVDRGLYGCSADNGDGRLAAFFNTLSTAFRGPLGPGTPIGPGACATLGPAPEFEIGDVHLKLNEHNISWRGTLNWKPDRDTLLYASISRGYKSGSFPNVGAPSRDVWKAATQETVLAYEAGIKKTFLNGAVHIDLAGFYYDYTDKQFRGTVEAQPFGFLFRLLNIPKSHVAGFELSGSVRPVEGLTIRPAMTMVSSRIDGNYRNYDPFANNILLSGEAFPYTPKWSGNVDAEYEWNIGSNIGMYIGGNANYQDSTNGALGNIPDFRIKSYTLVDLRAGFRQKDGRWRAGIYVRNLTDKYYFTTADYVNDTLTRITGMPRTFGVSASFRY